MNGFMETFQDFKGCLNYITTVNYNLYCPYTDYLHSYFHIYIYSFLCTPSDSHKFKIVTDVYLERRRDRMKSDMTFQGLHRKEKIRPVSGTHLEWSTLELKRSDSM